MTDDKIQISFGEMLQGVVREFSDALVMVRRSHPSVTVRSVKLNIGQEPATDSEPIEATPRTGLLLKDRYPAVDKGWLMEVELGEGISGRLKNDPLEIQSLSLPTALDLLGDYPLVAIKGIDTFWNTIFADVEITRISHLARLSDILLQNLIHAHHSLLPREFRRKAQLLKLPIPHLLPSKKPDHSLYELLLFPAETLHDELGREHVSKAEIDKLYDFLETLNIVIDSDQLREIQFSQLFLQ